MADKTEPSKSPWTWRNFDNVVIRLLMIVAVGFVGFLVYLIVSTRTSPSSESQALVQMAQWTITTVLAGGAALIGVNWYQGEKRYQRDREDIDKSMEAQASASQEQFDNLKQQIQATAFFTSIWVMERKVGSRDDEQYIERCIAEYREIPPDLIALRDILAGWLLEEARRISHIPIANPTRIRVEPLRNFLPILKQDFPDKGNKLEEVLTFFEPNNHKTPDPEH